MVQFDTSLPSAKPSICLRRHLIEAGCIFAPPTCCSESFLRAKKQVFSECLARKRSDDSIILHGAQQRSRRCLFWWGCWVSHSYRDGLLYLRPLIGLGSLVQKVWNWFPHGSTNKSASRQISHPRLLAISDSPTTVGGRSLGQFCCTSVPSV